MKASQRDDRCEHAPFQISAAFAIEQGSWSKCRDFPAIVALERA
jgi:hypothetical protein